MGTAYVKTQQVANRARLELETVQRVFDVITAFLEEGTAVRILGFGQFSPILTEQHERRTPLVPGGVSTVPAGRIIRWKMSAALRASWKKPLKKQIREKRG
jgi:nucleoid DNA-binding protein